jgi:hypothetical protein
LQVSASGELTDDARGPEGCQPEEPGGGRLMLSLLGGWLAGVPAATA